MNQGLMMDFGNDISEKRNKSCFPNLSFKERMIAFVFFNAIAFLLQIGSLFRFLNSIAHNDPEHFALVYSFGNVLALVGMLFLIGIKQQMKMIVNENRRAISLVFFGSMVFCIVVSLSTDNAVAKFLVVIAVVVQMVSYWWYALSYIPFGRQLVKGCFSCLKTLFGV